VAMVGGAGVSLNGPKPPPSASAICNRLTRAKGEVLQPEWLRRAISTCTLGLLRTALF